MNSLSELNNFGGATFFHTDNRPSIVKFDRVTPIEPFNRSINITSTSNTYITPGIEITEIVNFSTANVRFQLTIYPGDVTPLTGSTISWPYIPSPLSLSTVGNVYTISGIRNVDDWNIIRRFDWTLPANFATKPNWYVEAKIIYYDSALGVDKNKSFLVYDYRFYKVAQLQATATITKAILTGVQKASATISSSSTISCTGRRFRGIVATPPSAFTLSATGHLLIENLTARAYTGNNENSIFSSDTPIIGDSNPSTTSTFDVVLTSSLGTFSTSSTTVAVSPFTITGSLTSVNSALANVKFYPTAGTSSNGTFTFQVKKDTVSQATRTVNLTGTAGTYSTTTTTYTTTTMFTPTNGDVLYGLADILLVGGGGGGAIGGGGGGGQVLEYTNIAITSGVKTVNVGLGGNAGGSASSASLYSGNNYNFDASDGGNSSALGYLAYGGSGGKSNVTGTAASYTLHTPNHNGGASGSGNSGGSAYNQYDSFSLKFDFAGGGGAGNGAVGQNGSSTDKGNGGDGTSSSLSGSSVYYGGGGGGGLGFLYLDIGKEAYGASGTNSPGGLGGGGNGAWYKNPGSPTFNSGTAGTANTGGGGGGGYAYYTPTSGGAGGSGIVIIKIHP
jgi:hypothetical protein